MKLSEKMVMAAVLLSVIVSAALFGVWRDKVLLYGPLLSLIYLTVAAWAVTIFVRRDPRTSFVLPPGGIPLLLFWLYSAALIPFAAIPYEAKISTLRFGCYFISYWAAANILSRFQLRKAVWGTVLTGLILIALYSLAQHHVDPTRLFGWERYADYGERLGGTYICPNHIAHLFQMWVPLCLLFVFLPSIGWFGRICFAYAVPLFILLIYQTQSRAGLLGLIAALSVTLLFVIYRKSRRGFFLALIVVPLLGAGALGALWAGSPMFRERMTPVVKVLERARAGDWERVAAIDFRPMTWADSVEMIKERPLFGFGPGNYGKIFPEYRHRWTANLRETVHPHNEYLELLIEYGLVGALLIAWALVSIVIALLRLIKTTDRPYRAVPAIALLAALAGSAVHGLFDFELRNFPNAIMLALLAGCATAPLLYNKPRDAGFLHIRSVVRLVLVAGCILSLLWALQVMSSAFLSVLGDRQRVVGQNPTAERFYNLATAIDSQNWRAYTGLGQMMKPLRYYEIDPNLKRAWAQKELAAFQKAYALTPHRSEIVYGMARAEMVLGNRDAGLDHFREAARISRFNDYYWRKLGIELRKAGLYDEALSVFTYAKKLDRSNLTVNKNLLWLKNKMK